MESSSKFRASMTISISLPSLCNTSAGIRNISDMRRQTFRKMHSFSNLKAMSSPLVSPLLFPRRIWYGQFVLKFTQEERECPNLIADYPARRAPQGALEARRDVLKSERKATARQRGDEVCEEKSSEKRERGEESWP